MNENPEDARRRLKGLRKREEERKDKAHEEAFATWREIECGSDYEFPAMPPETLRALYDAAGKATKFLRENGGSESSLDHAKALRSGIVDWLKQHHNIDLLTEKRVENSRRMRARVLSPIGRLLRDAVSAEMLAALPDDVLVELKKLAAVGVSQLIKHGGDKGDIEEARSIRDLTQAELARRRPLPPPGDARGDARCVLRQEHEVRPPADHRARR